MEDQAQWGNKGVVGCRFPDTVVQIGIWRLRWTGHVIIRKQESTLKTLLKEVCPMEKYPDKDQKLVPQNGKTKYR